MDSGLFIFFLACYYLEKRNTNYQKLIASVLLILLISTLIIKCGDNHQLEHICFLRLCLSVFPLPLFNDTDTSRVAGKGIPIISPWEMSHFESPEHCYDFHSVVKCFSPLNHWLVLDSDIKVLTIETVRMNPGQQKRSPQQHRSSLSFSPVGGWRAPEQHNLQLPIPKILRYWVKDYPSWSWCRDVAPPTILLCILWSGRMGFLGAAIP